MSIIMKFMREFGERKRVLGRSEIHFQSLDLGRSGLTRHSRSGFIASMRFAATAFGLFSFVLSDFSMGAVEEPKIVEKVTPLPAALSKDFEFRKTKLFYLSEKAPRATGSRQTTSTLGGKSNSPSQKTATLQDVPITFERQFRLFGAV